MSRTSTFVTIAIASLTIVGCKKPEAKDAPPAVAAAACKGPDVKGPIAWFEDDYGAALACAKASKRPLVIDMWAPWCHTCLSMSATVLVDPSLAPIADRFVFLALDTDRPINAAVVGKFALQNWPTYFVLDAADETIQGRWLGAASVTGFRQFLKDGEAAVLAKSGGAALDPLLAKIRDGDVAATRKDWPAAIAAYGDALATAPADWPRRADVLVAQISALRKHGDIAGCLALGTSAAASTGSSANATDFLLWAMDCADDKTADPAAAKALREAALAVLTRLDGDAAAPLSIDDRSDLMLNLRMVLETLGRGPEARAVAERQATMLDTAAKAAKTQAEAMTFNWHRAEVYVYLERGEQIVGALEQSTQDLPTEYDPPYRLAWVYMKMGKPADAARWARDAATKAYGPRKVRVQSLLVEAAKAQGDVAAEREARTAMIALLEGLPAEQAQPEVLAKARAELAAMSAAAASK